MLLGTSKRVDDVVDQGLCTGCGTCVAVCPRGSIEMKETASGLLAPVIDSRSCNDCSLCARICPGDHLERGLVAEGTDLAVGPLRSCHLVQHREPDVLATAQSGGAVTGLLLHLLESGHIDHALVTVMPDDGALRPYPILTRDPEAIRGSSGSKYCPVPLNVKLPDVKPDERIAVVGLPCHLHGVVQMYRYLPKRRRKNLLLVGLVCDRVLSFHAMDYLILRAGLKKQDVRSFDFRSKASRGWPGDVRIVKHSGSTFFLPAKERIACKDFFTPQRCRLCFDKMNVLSDLTCGDPHGLSKDAKGWSSVLTRTQAGQTALESAIDAGIFAGHSVTAEDLLNGQHIERKRQEYATYVRLWEARGRTAPRVSTSTRHSQPPLNPIERRLYERRLFDFPKLVRSNTPLRKSLRVIRWNGRMRRLDRFAQLLIRKVAT